MLGNERVIECTVQPVQFKLLSGGDITGNYPLLRQLRPGNGALIKYSVNDSSHVHATVAQ